MQPAQRHLLREQIYGELLRAIVHGELAPGTNLRDADLAVQLGASRTPVREALARLADDGLVETKPNAFTRVAPIDERAAHEAAVLNQSLHALATRLACAGGRFTPDHGRVARRANRAFAESLRNHDLASALAADHDVHLTFVDAAGNEQLAVALERITPLLRRHALARFASLPARRSVDVHERLVRAAEQGDVATAVALTEENWGTLVDLVRPAATGPDPSGPAPSAPIATDPAPGDLRAAR